MNATLSGTSVKGRCHFSKVEIVLIMDSGEVQNFVGIHPTSEEIDRIQPSNSAEVKESMVQEFHHFHPDIVKLFRFAVPSASPTSFTDRSTAQQKKSNAGRSSFMILCQIGNLENYC